MTDAHQPQTSEEPTTTGPVAGPVGPVGPVAEAAGTQVVGAEATTEIPVGPAPTTETPAAETPAPGVSTAEMPAAGQPVSGAPGGSGPWAPGGWSSAGWGPGPWGPGPWGPGAPGNGWGPPGAAWTAPPPAGQPATPSRPPVGRSKVFGGAALLTALATLLGVGIGYAVWQPSGTTPASAVAPVGGGTSSSGGTGGSSGASGGYGSGSSPFGNGSPFGGSSGSGSTGSSRGSTSSAAGSPSNLSSIAAGVDPGLVDINTTLSYQSEQAAGTGMVLTADGEVLTNNHVIDGATSISVTDIGNGKTYTASVVGYDRAHDIAVIQLHNASGLQTVTTGDSSKVAVGEGVVGIGNAGGAGGTPSVAGGSVTALNQAITASDEGAGTSEQLTGLIEVNSDIQPGDSGGPLVNTSGQVVGMDTAASASQGFTFQDATGQGYAIPINKALATAKLIEAGTASSTVHIGQTGFLGVEIQASAADGGQAGGGTGFGSGGFGRFGEGTGSSTTTGFKTGGTATATAGTATGSTTAGSGGTGTAGADVAGVISGSPAEQAGLAEGDVITAVDGKTVSSADDLTTLMMAHHPGDKVQLTWTDSAGQQHTATVQLATGPAD